MSQETSVDELAVRDSRSFTPEEVKEFVAADKARAEKHIKVAPAVEALMNKDLAEFFLANKPLSALLNLMPELIAKAPEVPKVKEVSAKRVGDEFNVGVEHLYALLFPMIASFAAWGTYGWFSSREVGVLLPLIGYAVSSGVGGFVVLVSVFSFLEGSYDITARPSKWLGRLSAPITNTALGLWTVVKGTGYGIGYAIYGIGVGLYYIVTNQLMPGLCASYFVKVSRRLTECDMTREDASGWAFTTTALPHLLGVVGSFMAFFWFDQVPLAHKLIFGWWAFYALNVFYLIGSKVRENKKVVDLVPLPTVTEVSASRQYACLRCGASHCICH